MSGRLLLSLVVLLAVPCLADNWNKTYTVSGKPEVRVHLNDGRITVHTANANQVQASLNTSGWRIPDQVKITERQDGNRVEIEVHVPSVHFGIGINRSLELELGVPTEATLDLRTDDGRITVDGVKGDERLSTGDGRIEATRMDGTLRAESGDGHLRLQGRFDGLDARTGDGRIDVEAAAGSRGAADWVVQTKDGSIEVRLPQDFAADLYAHTGDGHVDSDFPLTVDAGRVREGSVRGRLNGGGKLLEIRSGDGSIHIGKL